MFHVSAWSGVRAQCDRWDIAATRLFHSPVPPTHDWVAMNSSVPVLHKTSTGPATASKRVPLVPAAKGSDSASASLLGRVLPSADKQGVGVAAFQSSI
jgi:hypothetical protein